LVPNRSTAGIWSGPVPRSKTLLRNICEKGRASIANAEGSSKSREYFGALMAPALLVELGYKSRRHPRCIAVVGRIAGRARRTWRPQAPSPSQDRSRWRSHTQPLTWQKRHFTCIAARKRRRKPRERAADAFQRPSFPIRNFFLIKCPRWASQNLSQSTVLWRP
jgi:hypothetical protein